MKLHLLNGGRLRMRRATYFPGAPREEMIDIPVPCFLIRHPKGDVVFDTGCNPAVATDAAAAWGGLARVMQPIHGPDEHIGTALAALGVQADAVPHVVLSHLHADHAGCNALFRNAEFVVQASEHAAASAEDAAAQGYIRGEWDIGRPMRQVSGEVDLFGDGLIRLLPLPGHTPGQMGALLTLAGGRRVFLAVDAVPMQAMLAEDIMPRNMRDPETARASIARVRALHADGVGVICGHDMAQWQALCAAAGQDA